MKKLYSLAIAALLGTCGLNAAAITANDLAGDYTFTQGTWYDYYVFGSTTGTYISWEGVKATITVDGNTVTINNFGYQTYDGVDYPYSIEGTFDAETSTIKFDTQDYADYYSICSQFDGWYSLWSSPGYYSEEQMAGGFTATVAEDGTITFDNLVVCYDYYNNGCFYPYDYTLSQPVLSRGEYAVEGPATEASIEGLVGKYVIKSFTWWDSGVLDYTSGWTQPSFAGDTVTVTANGYDLTFENFGKVDYNGTIYPMSITGTFDPEGITIDFAPQSYAWYYILCGQGDGSWYNAWAVDATNAAEHFAASIGEFGTITFDAIMAIYHSTDDDSYSIYAYNYSSDPVKLTKIADQEEGKIQETLGADAAAPVRYFNIQGMELSQPSAHGVYIMRQGTSTRKIAK
jgi:hypothetical protein